MRPLVLLAAALLTWSLGDLWDRIERDTISYLETARGVGQFKKEQYGPSSASFKKAGTASPSPAHSFNLGTAEVASGDREGGSAALGEAMKDPALHADALYNRGTSALAAKSYDHAVRDFSESLRLRPANPAAKRNLEIALRRKEEAERDKSANQNGGKGDQQKPEPRPQGGMKNQDQAQPKSDPSIEALLRAVQQQEQEELSRMHRANPERKRLGW